jgi:hypothetical protein
MPRWCGRGEDRQVQHNGAKHQGSPRERARQGEARQERRPQQRQLRAKRGAASPTPPPPGNRPLAFHGHPTCSNPGAWGTKVTKSGTRISRKARSVALFSISVEMARGMSSERFTQNCSSGPPSAGRGPREFARERVSAGERAAEHVGVGVRGEGARGAGAPCARRRPDPAHARGCMSSSQHTAAP